MTSLLVAALALALSEEVGDARLQSIVRQSNACLKEQVEKQIPDSTLSLTEVERAMIRASAAIECSSFNDQLAEFSNAPGTDSKSAQEVAKSMMATSLAIANGMISVRLSINSEKAKTR